MKHSFPLLSATLKHSLYPTTFRWNSFPEEGARTPTRLYIPLRSDETPSCGSDLFAQSSLYPTTFRWNSVNRKLVRPRVILYIPLRSDETISRYMATFRLSTLYPTTFRWNVRIMPYSSRAIRLYIPLRSDETEGAAGGAASDSSLYPTTFRWNQAGRQEFRRIFVLYIPLRSDETDSSPDFHRLGLDFISHYVQMKRRSSNSPFDFWDSLYPTTFRWNTRRSVVRRPSMDLYIPLRSDEMHVRLAAKQGDPPLYPTTFRWNPFCFGDFEGRSPPLYPTTFRWNLGGNARRHAFRSFISHYVQMKSSGSSPFHQR